MSEAYRIVAAGDAAVLVQFDERIDPIVNARAVVVADAIARAELPGVRDVVPTFRSVAVYFDPLQTEHTALFECLHRAAAVPVPAPAERDVIQVPVCYGGDFGPDLPEVARFAGMSEEDVSREHTSRAYRVFMLGFMPGFAYMGTVSARIAVPRHRMPRTRVPAGAVAIAGGQTGIYPAATPGGWQVIGRTPAKPFDLDRAEPCLFRPGDTVQFVAIDRTEYDTLAAAG